MQFASRIAQCKFDTKIEDILHLFLEIPLQSHDYGREKS